MHARRSLTVIGAIGAFAFAAASPAYAYDCIRVSSSPQGLQHSSANGQWIYLTIDNLLQGGVDEGFITAAQVPCLKAEWTRLGEPTAFDIGGGVAGAKGAQQSGHISDADFFELAKNAPLKVVVNGKGVDHLDDALALIVPRCSS